MTQMVNGGGLPVPSAPLRVAVAWRQGPGVPDVDVFALLLDTAGRVRSGADLVFRHRPAHPSGTVRHLGTDQEAGGTGSDRLWLDLAAVEPGVGRVVVVAASVAAETFGQLPPLDVRVDLPTGQALVSFTLGDRARETARVIGEFRRGDGGWTFRAYGRHHRSGPAGRATDPCGTVVEAGHRPTAAHPSTVGQAPSFPPFEHRGSGRQRVTCPPDLPPGARVVVEIECRNSISVHIDSCDAHGRGDRDLLSAYEDEVHGRTVAAVPADRPLSLLVCADTPWTLRVLPLARARRLVHGLPGRGPDLLVYEGPAAVLSFAHRGESNFAVWHYVLSPGPDRPEDDEDLLVNEVGRIDVLAPVRVPGVLRIEADGAWHVGVVG
ncbi:TerD family protein [Streptomyces bullii]|uniref:TerD family protein n=1 Tax=Streptomyces bullii TaxID=349910 RepID=A0ABW0UGE0_9ACTN